MFALILAQMCDVCAAVSGSVFVGVVVETGLDEKSVGVPR